MSMGGKTHLHLYVCGFTVNARGVCLFSMTWKFGIKPEINSESGCNGQMCLPVLNLTRQVGSDLWKPFFSPLHVIIF